MLCLIVNITVEVGGALFIKLVASTGYTSRPPTTDSVSSRYALVIPYLLFCCLSPTATPAALFINAFKPHPLSS